jgi:hypothetical protein
MPLRLFSARPRTPTREKSPKALEEHDHPLLLAARGGPPEALPKRRSQRIELGAQQNGPFRICASISLPRWEHRALGPGALVSHRVAGRRGYYPFHSRMAKVESLVLQ